MTEYPRYWRRQLKDELIPKLGRFWKGSYGYIEPEEVQEIRHRGNPEGAIQDEFCGQGGNVFQNLELEKVDEGRETWPPAFEDYLQALEEPKKRMRAEPQSRGSNSGPEIESPSFRFGGFGEDAKEGFLVDGWLNTLPRQSGIPGWQRLTMMKYWADEFGNVDYNVLWAYEGIVLPGGKIVVGRWWCPIGTEFRYSGPFILWCVDTPALLRESEEKMKKEKKNSEL